MKFLEFISNSLQYTQKLGFVLGEMARPGDIYLLVGNLGSGKTSLTQGIAKGLKITTSVISPTFVLVREYRGRLPLYHIDLYRLNNISEILNLGLEQYLDNSGLCVVEWAEKGQPVLPRDNLMINLNYMSKNRRKFNFTANGKKYLGFVRQLDNRLHSWN